MATPTKLKVRIKKDVRIRPYVVHQCDLTLEVALDAPGEDLEAAFDEAHEAVIYLVNKMEEEIESDKNINR